MQSIGLERFRSWGSGLIEPARCLLGSKLKLQKDKDRRWASATLRHSEAQSIALNRNTMKGFRFLRVANILTRSRDGHVQHFYILCVRYQGKTYNICVYTHRCHQRSRNLRGVWRIPRGVSRTRSQKPVWGFGKPSGVPLPSANFFGVRLRLTLGGILAERCTHTIPIQCSSCQTAQVFSASLQRAAITC